MSDQKKYNWIVLLGMLLLSFTLFSQNIIVSYGYRTAIDTLENYTNSYTLMYKDGRSYFSKDTANLKDSLIEIVPHTTRQNQLIHSEHINKEFYYLTDINQDSLFAIINNKQVVDRPLDWGWQPSTGTKMIQGYLCTKAVSNFMGKDFEVWYTIELPYNTGPEYYHGLPGVILQASDGSFEYLATAIEFPDSLQDIAAPKLLPGKKHTFLETQVIPLKPSKDKPIRKMIHDPTEPFRFRVD
ncbi:GLPGLI family protein [Myroides sp. LJL116]